MKSLCLVTGEGGGVCMADYGNQTCIKRHLNDRKSFHFMYIFGHKFVVFDPKNENSSKLSKHPQKNGDAQGRRSSQRAGGALFSKGHYDIQKGHILIQNIFDSSGWPKAFGLRPSSRVTPIKAMLSLFLSL